MWLKWHKQRGDTIVEVMIAIAIISLVLTSAYVITNKNTLAIQDAQERSQAQHLVESQIEMLRSKGGLDNSGDCFIGTAEKGPADSGAPCSNIRQTDSGATYSVAIDGPVNSVYTVTAHWTSLNDQTDNASSLTMYYRLD